MNSPYDSQSPVELHNATPSNYITIYVLLSGVAGGLGIVLAVLICCKVCFRKRKKLYRKTVLLVHSSPEKSSFAKYNSHESLSYESYNLYSFSEGDLQEPTNDEQETVIDVDTVIETKVRTKDSLDKKEEASSEKIHGECSTKNSVSPQTSAVIEAVESRRRSSGGLQRQSSICIPDSDENLDIIISESNILADITSLERARRSDSEQHKYFEVSLNSSLDMEHEPTQISVEVHEGCNVESWGSSQNKALKKIWVPDNKDKCGRTMDLEDYHYSQTHNSNTSSEWMLGENKRSASSYDVKLSEVVRWRDAPQRTASVESNDLEELMETRRKKNSVGVIRQPSSAGTSVVWSDEDDEPKSKVRYNDTGSKEEVNEEVLDLFVEDIDLIKMDESSASAAETNDPVLSKSYVKSSDRVAAQYRELWQLRATLEDEDLSDVTCFEDDNCDSVKGAFEKDDNTNVSMEVSHEVVQESGKLENVENQSCSDNPDASLTMDSNSCRSKQSRRSSKLLEPSTCHSRRQNYKSILTTRMHQNDSSGGPTTSIDSVGPPSTENSFDSIGTGDTEEGSATDASRPEAASTSFESTTDNTDSPSDTHAHNRLQQMKADSGYRSLETQSTAKKAPRLSKKKLQFVLDDVSIENVPPEGIVASSIDEGVEVSEDKDIESLTEEIRNSNSSQSILSDLKTADNSLKRERARKGSRLSLSASIERKDGKSASKKRREYMKERQSSLSSLSVGEPAYRFADYQGEFETDSKSDQQSGVDSFDEGRKLPNVSNNAKSSIFLRFFRSSSYRSSRSRIHLRDYSIDEKSDSLFREFSRRDPTYETSVDCLMRSRSPRLHPTHSTRRFHHRCRQMKHDSNSPRAGRRKLSPQDSIEEETSHAESEQEGCDSQVSGGSISFLKSSEESLLEQTDSLTEIPAIKLVQEEPLNKA